MVIWETADVWGGIFENQCLCGPVKQISNVINSSDTFVNNLSQGNQKFL